jgi:hypothetical protein
MPTNLKAIPRRKNARGKNGAGEGARPIVNQRRSGEPRHIAQILAELPELRFTITPHPLPPAEDESSP